MPRILATADNQLRIISPTTTAKLAQRILSSLRVMADVLPRGLNTPTTLELLLGIYLGEEESRYYRLEELQVSDGLGAAVTRRWIAALVSAGLVEEHDGLVALTTQGHALMVEAMERIFAAQRRLD